MSTARPPGPGPAAPRQRVGGYADYAPPPALADAAEGVWIHRAPHRAPPGRTAAHRVLPDPALSIAFSCRRDEDGRPVDPVVLAIGPKTRPRVFAPPPGHELVAVRLKLEWVATLIGLDGTDLRNVEPALDDAAPGLARVLLARLAESRSAGEAAAALAAALARRAAARPLRAGAAARALDLVRRTAGRLRVDQIAAHVGISPRQLHRVVHRDARISLKRYARTTRFLHVIAAADRHPDRSLARLASDAGYCDQSHLVRDCRGLTGLPPLRILHERRAEAETSNPA